MMCCPWPLLLIHPELLSSFVSLSIQTSSRLVGRRLSAMTSDSTSSSSSSSNGRRNYLSILKERYDSLKQFIEK
jgi:hypothetical protein